MKIRPIRYETFSKFSFRNKTHKINPIHFEIFILVPELNKRDKVWEITVQVVVSRENKLLNSNLMPFFGSPL